MPTKYDKLYKVWNGKLEEVTFLEESVLEGARLPTWLVRNSDHRKVRTSVGSYHTSKSDAWKEYLQGVQEALARDRKGLDETKERIKGWRVEIKQIREILKNC